MTMRFPLVLGSAIALATVTAALHPAQAGAVFDQVRATKILTCGINADEPDYSKADTHGNLALFGADLCRAVAQAIAGPEATVKAVRFLDEPSGLTALKEGKIDMMAGATPSLQNTGLFGIGFGPVMFYDGQGFLVAKSSGIHALEDLAGKSICIISDDDADNVLQTEFKRRGIVYGPFPFEEIGEMQAAFLGGHCDALTADISALADTIPLFHTRADDFMILSETITRDPFAPAYRMADPQFAAVVNWAMEALLLADEHDITRANIDAMKTTDELDIQGLVNGKRARGLGEMLGLDDDWAVRVIKAVGNYGEIFDRDLGVRSPLRLPRGQNQPWNKGGLMYALPIR